MLSASDTFKASLRTSHVVAIAADLIMPGVAPFSVPVQGGGLTIDRSARTRRTGSLAMPWTTELTRLGLTADVRTLPFGSYVRVKRGVRFADGSREYVTLGYLRAESVAWATHEDTATIELADRMAQVSDEKLLSPYNASGMKPSAAAVDLVDDVFGGSITYTVTTNVAAEPTLADVIYPAGDRAEAVANLALVAGAEAYFDANGNFRFDPIATVQSSPVWTIDAGESGVMISADESLDRTRVYNGVLVEGQATADQPPVSALVYDSDPTSRTLWGGPFGKVARIETSTAVQTVAQAQAAALALLTNQLGLERQVRITSVPNPLLVVGDTIRITFQDGTSELHLIEAISQPLDAVSAQEIVSRTTWTSASVASLAGREAWNELREAKVYA